jgi:hypothetical protein
MRKRHRADENPETELDEPTPVTAHPPRQRSARTDRSMRDGDSGHGNPYESDGDEVDAFLTSTDRDIDDTAESYEPLAGPSGGAIGGTPAGKRARAHANPGAPYRSPSRGDSTVGSTESSTGRKRTRSKR